MKEYKKPYEFSRDYKKLKELLDDLCEVVCYIDYVLTFATVRDICIARKTPDGRYVFSGRGIYYRDYIPSLCKYTIEEAMEADNVEFIPPTKIE